jgi:pyruvate,water dikinase
LVEDAAASSMAGQFVSKIGVHGWDHFLRAVVEVKASAARASSTDGPAPMAVLVQPLLETPLGGVLFGLDPVSGDRRRIVIEATEGGPKALVDGTTSVDHVVASRTRLRPSHRRGQRSLVDRHTCRRLVHLSRRVDRLFGTPQDVEWALDTAKRLWLLQSRPVTATSDQPAADSPLLGPGPVAETFPDPLSPLEVDLWVEPLRVGMANALRLTRAVPERRLAVSPKVIVVGGRVACDLEVLGVAPPRHPVLATLSPRRGARHLVSAWRTGRLRIMMPQLAGDLATATDEQLGRLRALDEYSDRDLVQLLVRAREWLASLHAHQMAAGIVLPPADTPTAAGLALQCMSADRARQCGDDEIVEKNPVVLALSAPRVGPLPVLPSTMRRTAVGTIANLADLDAREALRLRARWVQELTARSAWSLGRRLAGRDLLRNAEDVRWLRLDELAAVVDGQECPPDLLDRSAALETAPLPAAFRLSAAGTVVPARLQQSRRASVGMPVGGGRGAGRVCERRNTRPTGPEVLVVRTLDPRLAPALPGLAGLVSETGGQLSHLAILAREQRVPVVVGVPGAVERFPPGTLILVDGDVGDVVALEERT